MNMLAEDGLKKASIALAVLERSTAEPGSALDLVDTPGGVRLLLQTALLHPEPSFRLGATMCVHNLVSQNEPHFLQVALDEPCMLPKALARMLAEADRSVQEAAEHEKDGDAGGKKAVDPDLPVRRVALEMFSTLVQRTTPEVALRVLESEQLCTTPFALLSSSRDAQICQGAAELLLAILARDDTVAGPVRNVVEEAPEDVAATLLPKVLDAEQREIRTTLRSLLLVLRSSTRLQTAATKVSTAATVAGHAETCGDVVEARELRLISAWLQAAQHSSVGLAEPGAEGSATISSERTEARPPNQATSTDTVDQGRQLCLSLRFFITCETADCMDLSTDTGGFVADAVPRGWLFFDMLRVVTIRSILS